MDGISKLVQAVQNALGLASSNALAGADKQRDLIAEQERLRAAQAEFEAKTSDEVKVFEVDEELVVGGSPAVLVRSTTDDDDVDP